MAKNTPIIPHLEQYAGPLAIEERAMDLLIDRIGAMDIPAHVAAAAASGQKQDYGPDVDKRPDGVAVVEIVGAISKYGSSLSSAPSTLAMRKTLRALRDDAEVKAIVLKIDSPGGMVAGVDDLAADVRRLNAVKPVVAYIEDLGASAAYWIASQAGRVVANESAEVGSIGTYCVVPDSSVRAAASGIKVHVIRAGAYKGIGTTGTELTPEHLAEIQRRIDATNDLFVKAVATGRRMTVEQVKTIADGRVHTAAAAKAMGLVDEIEDFDAAVASLVTKAPPRRAAAKETPMSETNTPQAPATPNPATLGELKAAMPKADAEFLLSCLERSLTVEAAKDEHIARLNDQVEAAKADAAAAKAAGTTAVKPLAEGRENANQASARDEVEQKVSERQKLAGCTRAEAFRHVMKSDASLRDRYETEMRGGK